jgi:gamma-glutamylcyclotransferase (GGCT)/AIG2-like uncharacterized protein YtfP
MLHIFGYGTFITLKLYENKGNVKPAFLPNYFRVLKPGENFPFIIKDNSLYGSKSGFWGLVFEINNSELEKLDHYEGKGYLYDRITETVIHRDASERSVMMYYPREELISAYNLKKLIDLGDLWRAKIVKDYPEIIKKYPDLARTDNPTKKF